MNGKDAIEALRWLCGVIDGGKPAGGMPRALVRCAVPAALGIAACAGAQEPQAEPPSDGEAQVATEAPDEPELIMDGVDNDGDGLVDCDDPDCSAMAACLASQLKEVVPHYGVVHVPPEPPTPIPCEPRSES